MEQKEISIICEAVLAFCTFIGVGSALAYYMKVLQSFSTIDIIATLFIYVLSVIIIILNIMEMVKNESKLDN